jgi:phage FluMu protein Com
MGFFSNLFGEKKPVNSAENNGVSMAGENPFTGSGVQKTGSLIFKCPTCSNMLSASLIQIDPIIGIHVACPQCKNISHVPGAYKAKANPTGMRITGGVRVAVSQFGEWYFGHPLIQGLIKSGQSDLLYNHGLWAFCGACYHQFPATVLCSFAIACRASGFVFNARTPESARDMEALRAGHCPQCRNSNLIAIATEIPGYVRNAIAKTNR